MNKEQKMTRTTELLKDLETNKQIRISYNNQLQWSVCQTKIDLIKSELKGRLDALKEEKEFLERIDLRSCDSIEVMDWNGEEIWLDKYVSERIASIQEEIKLIEKEI